MGISADYRNTDRCPILSRVGEKKEELERKIKEEHKKVKIMYYQIKDKQKEYFLDFAKIYNFKCAYCGAALKFTGIRLFEIDHFICESVFPNDTEGRAQAGRIENLIFSCYLCNRGKSNLHIKEDCQDLLNPDDNSIADVFYRDEEYYIRINEDYSENNLIHLFYEKLLLGSETRRLDFLLLEMGNLIEELKNSNPDFANKLEQCQGRLMQKRNCTLY